MLFVLTAIEEVIVGLIHGHTVAESLSEFLGGSLLQVVALCLVMLLILIPYLAFKEVDEALGQGRIWQVMLEYRDGRRVRTHGGPEPDGSQPSSVPVPKENMNGPESDSAIREEF